MSAGAHFIFRQKGVVIMEEMELIHKRIKRNLREKEKEEKEVEAEKHKHLNNKG